MDVAGGFALEVLLTMSWLSTQHWTSLSPGHPFSDYTVWLVLFFSCNIVFSFRKGGG